MIPPPRGERSKAYMELLPKFYKAVWPYCNSDSYFRNQFMTERSRQYETDVKVATETGFQKRRQSSCMWKVFYHFIYSKSQ